MANLKLGKLPDRTPSKITITVSADLSQALQDYAALYRQTYGESETWLNLSHSCWRGFWKATERLPRPEKKACRLPASRRDRDACRVQVLSR